MTESIAPQNPEWVVLAEKADQGKDYAMAFKNHKRYKDSKGYFWICQDPDLLNGDEVVVIALQGHVLALKNPEEYNPNWGMFPKEEKFFRLDTMPIMPQKFELTIADGKYMLVQNAKRFLTKAKTVIIATDPDRAGEHIAVALLRFLNVDMTNTKRLWINSLEKGPVRKGFQNLRDASETYPYYLEDFTRSVADWMIGMNLTCLYSQLCWDNGVRTSGALAIGRVLIPTMMLVWQRELEIANFKPEPYYIDTLLCKTDKGEEFVAQRSGEFKDKSAIPIISKLRGNVTDIKTERESTIPEKLIDLQGLKDRATAELGYKPDDTQDAAEKLYQKHYLTYPRTSINVITENEFNYLLDYHSKYKAFFPDANLVRTMPKKTWVDASKAKEHLAIVPTRTIPDLSSLPEKEKNVYLLAVKSVLAMFEDDYYYDKTTIEVENDYTVSGSVDVDLGWKKFYKKSKNTVLSLPSVKVGEELNIKQEIAEYMTKPPKPYTASTLEKAMENVHKLIDDKATKKILKDAKGLGTPATRSAIVKKVINHHKLLEEIPVKGKKKLPILHTTAKGKMLAELISKTNKVLGEPKMTAEWEDALSRISKLTLSPKAFLDEINKLVWYAFQTLPTELPKVLKTIDTSALGPTGKSAPVVIGKCPICGTGNILDSSHPKFNAYTCSEETCELRTKSLFKGTLSKWGQKEINPKEAVKLIKGKKIPCKLTFKSKKYDMLIFREAATGYIKWEFANPKKK